jgi:uncharacterized protein involved in outer membrane biogenesis
MRKAAMIAAAVVLAATLLALLVPRLVSLDAWKPRIVAFLEEKTGRKVSFSRISLALIPRIAVRVSDLAVSGDPGHPGENLLSVPEAEIRMALLPLLAGKAEFGKFLLRRPEVLFRKYRDGTHSATQIADRLARGEAPAPTPAGKVSVALKALSIEEAKLTLILEGEDGGETRWKLDPLTIRLSGMDEPRKDFEIETRVDGAVRGEVEFSGQATRDGSAADAAAFRLGGKGTAFGQQVAVEGRMSALTGSAEMDLNVTFPKIDMEKIPGIFTRPPEALSKASLRGMAALAVKVSGNMQATVIEADLRFASLSAQGRASLVPQTGKREWNASARIASLADFAKSSGEGLSKWAPAGRLAVTAKGKRPSASAKDAWDAALDLGGAGFRLPEPKMTLQGLNGRVELSERTVDFQQLSGSLNGQRFTLSGPVSLGAAPAGPLSLYMAYLDLDELFPPREAGGQAKRDEPASAAGKEKEAKRISARGNIRIDAGKGRGLEFRDLSGTGRYEGGTLFIDSMRARLFGGEATISGRIGLSGKSPDFRLKMQVKDVAAEEILSRKTALKDFLFGKASLSAEIGGGARDFADFTRTAAGSGSFRVVGGKIRGVDLLASAAGVSGLQAVLPSGPSVPAGRAAETSFSDLSADFRVEGGKIRTDALRIISEKVGLAGSAVLGFDRTLDFRGTVVLSKEMSARARGAAGRFLADPSGRVEIPLVMTGTITSPSIAIDAGALARGLGGKAIRNLTEKAPGRPEPGKGLEGLFERLLPGKR